MVSPFSFLNHRLELRLFGAFQLNFPHQPPIELRSNPERALLAYLAVESDRSHNREFLCDLIWPGLIEEKARNNLRVTLSRLKKNLEAANQDSPVITTTGQSIQINVKEMWVDALIFSDLVDQSNSHPHPPDQDCIACFERYKQAADLFQGEFLKGFSLADNLPFMEWMVVQREKLHRQAINIFYKLADYYLRRGKLDEVQVYAQRQLELEPWREEAHRQLMTCLAINDQKSAALAQYERCAKILEEELGVTPSSDTQELYKRIKRSRMRKSPEFPTASTIFFGRHQEQAEIIQTLSQPDCQLLTLVGMGGVGKTRLAIHVAEQYEHAFLDGSIYVSMATIQTPERIPDAIADALGFSFGGSREPLQQLLEYLENREFLFVLDNFEHLLEAAQVLDRIWGNCPGVKMLVTSRERLGLKQECLIELKGLPVLPETEDPQSSPAVGLLLACINKLDPSFTLEGRNLDTAIELCRRVEGMPLALEMIAPMVKVLSMDEILSDIETLEQSDLEPVFERSWILLSPEEKTGLMKLSIFNSPFTRQAAEQVAKIDLATFTSYMDKSFVRRAVSKVEDDGGKEVAFFDFHPLLKQFLHQKLVGNPKALEGVTESHADYFLEFLEQAHESILTPDESKVIKKVSARHEDIVTAMKWGCTHGRYESIRKGLQINIHYFESYTAFNSAEKFYSEIIQILKEVKRQQKGPTQALNRALARAICYLGWQEMHFSDYEAAIKHESEGVQLAKEAQDGSVEILGLNAIGVIHARAGNLDPSNQFFHLALEAAQKTEEILEDRWHVAGINLNLGRNAMAQSHLDQAGIYFDTSMRIFKEIGHYWGIAGAHYVIGELYIFMERYEDARVSLETGLHLAETHNYQWVKIGNLVTLGDLAFKLEDWKSALRYYQEGLDAIEESGEKNILEEVRRKLKETKSQMGKFKAHS